MQLLPDNLYHIYNRGNNRQLIFFKPENYLYFLRKVRLTFLPSVDILSYCLMPNHFHFMIYTRLNFTVDEFSNDFRTLLSSYTRAINRQEGRTGSLFQQNSKALQLTDLQYAQVCFHYIHQNPLKASLVSRLEDWPYTSFLDYAGFRNGTLCNRGMAQKFLDIPNTADQVYEWFHQVLSEELLSKIR